MPIVSIQRGFGGLFSTIFGNMFGPEAKEFYSSDSHQFDQYVRRLIKEPFPFCRETGGQRTIKNLWRGRKLRVKLDSKGPWREAKVLSWLNYLPGPYSIQSMWDIVVELTAQTQHFLAGDLVSIHALQGVQAKHNGNLAVVVRVTDRTRRCQVRYLGQDGAPCEVSLRQANLSLRVTIDLHVHRINVHGGGTFRHVQKSLGTRLISFQWLDEPSPHLNLDEDWFVTCPTCRKKTTCDDICFSPDDHKNMAVECPVCLEGRKDGQKLLCGHHICGQCLERWRKKRDGSGFFDVTGVQVELSWKEIQEKRKEKAAFFGKNRYSESFEEKFCDAFSPLIEETDDGDIDSLIRLKRWLVTTPLSVWGACPSLFNMVRSLNTNAAEVVIDYFTSLKDTEYYRSFAIDCANEMLVLAKSADDSLAPLTDSFDADMNTKYRKDPSIFFEYQMYHICQAIALTYEKREMFQQAIEWYQKSLEHTATINTDLISKGFNNLALAQKCGSFFESSERNYKKSIELAMECSQHDEADQTRHNLRSLRQEMDNWQGTSGEMTPRMDG